MKRLVIVASAVVLTAAACSDSGDDAADLAEGGGPSATLKTSAGDIEVALFADRAPETVANFVDLATGEKTENPVTGDDAFYDGTIFHRVIPGFMIQGGDPEGTGTGGPGYTFADEIDDDLTFSGSGVLAMANSGPDTNGSQFFITTDPTPHLQGDHTIFGSVTDEESMAVVEEIAAVPTGPDDRPVDDVVLEELVIHE
ncbi:peptidylprolyl isomerase [Spiractinospora alimapuensis]|uniref:peptidylprolyl isomerase n=1 Tax=Spiractinospora alimapuensis TaxID=2820884 RepID=UPI001F41F07C|nr:peptidylprolyl isomerase [Spiractinospora alimapuensis]QVQ52540.1 peptidylprolyl isomerase [Spiractinospora alimapuensis]